jgi:nicotinate dehydrogenase subunit B
MSMQPPHDLLYGWVIRPPATNWDGARITRAAPSLKNEAEVRERTGIVAIALRGHFVGVVAESIEAARGAADFLAIDWHDGARPASVDTPTPLVRRQTLARQGDVGTALAACSRRITHTYGWPLDPAQCRGVAIADVRPESTRIWMASEPPAGLHQDLGVLLGMPPERVEFFRHAFDAADPAATPHAAADAALFSQIAGRPVQVALTAAALRFTGSPPRFLHSIDAGVDDTGYLQAYALVIDCPTLPSQPLALTLTGAPPPPGVDEPLEGAADALLPPYEVANLEVICTSGRQGAAGGDVGAAAGDFEAAACAHAFAVESHCDETAAALGCDPVQWRLRHLHDARGAALIRRTAERAAWRFRPPVPPVPLVPPLPPAPLLGGGVRSGRGFAYAHSVDRIGSSARSWSAWVADVQVDTTTGDVTVNRVVVGHDADDPLAELGRERAVRIAGTPRYSEAVDAIAQLTAEPRFDTFSRALSHPPTIELMGVEAVHARVPSEAYEGAQGAATQGPSYGTLHSLITGPAVLLPAAPAIANAIFNATGIRLREPPFSAERVRRALDESRGRPIGPTRTWVAGMLAGIAGVLGIAGMAASIVPWRAPMAPVAPPGPGYFSAAAIERGRLVAAAGDCGVCHTAPQGAPYAGGLGLETPFGTVVSTNITPDAASGIGTWSYAAFERAMRSGIHRDGSHLYPAFPYTAFAKVSDGDLLALYAYLMSQPAVRLTPPPTRLAFPLNWRPLVAAWNLLFHRTGVFTPDPARSPAWNRGAYLVDGLGHCGACHSPRNALGAERHGRAYLAGGLAEGWEAPALTARSKAPKGWTREDFYDYLRTGYSASHGAAAGPMAAVVSEMRALPDDDVRAIATYLAAIDRGPAAAARSTGAPPESSDLQATAESLHPLRLAAAAAPLGARIYSGACAVCHEPDVGPPTFGVKISLAPTTTLHAASPNNLIRVLLDGVSNPPTAEIGYMPSFHDTLDDAQLAELTAYLRARFAPGEPPWQRVVETAAALRSRSRDP